MVKKLIKYDLIAYFRAMTPFCIIVMAIGLFNRIIQLFENRSTSYNIIFISSTVALIISMIVLAVMTIVNVVSRFYKNLFTSEGYLSFALPVTPFQHIIAKLSAALIITIIAFAVIFISGTLATFGDVFIEAIKAANFIFGKLISFIGAKHTIFYIIEFIILFFALTGMGYTLFYGCTALGQTAKKNRVLAAFGYYFAYYLIKQVIGTIIVIIGSVYDFDWLIDLLKNIFENYPYGWLHIFLWMGIVFVLAFQALYFFITYRIIKNHLNLE